MAVTHGHGNPSWTRDETILALDLYLDCQGHIPSSSDNRVQALSEILKAFPCHSRAARKESFRNADGVAFKLQNLRQVATGKGLGNVSKTDQAVWNELGDKPQLTKELATLIRYGIKVCEGSEDEPDDAEMFSEGRVVTTAHKRRERNQKLRQRIIKHRKQSNRLKCEMCGCSPNASEYGEAIFEAHHLLPLASAIERKTTIKDMARMTLIFC